MSEFDDPEYEEKVRRMIQDKDRFDTMSYIIGSINPSDPKFKRYAEKIRAEERERKNQAPASYTQDQLQQATARLEITDGQEEVSRPVMIKISGKF
jgi:nitrate reductase alpha subunit